MMSYLSEPSDPKSKVQLSGVSSAPPGPNCESLPPMTKSLAVLVTLAIDDDCQSSRSEPPRPEPSESTWSPS